LFFPPIIIYLISPRVMGAVENPKFLVRTFPVPVASLWGPNNRVCRVTGHSCFISRSSRVHISARRPTILLRLQWLPSVQAGKCQFNTHQPTNRLTSTESAVKRTKQVKNSLNFGIL
jgi:hypothetical protein